MPQYNSPSKIHSGKAAARFIPDKADRNGYTKKISRKQSQKPRKEPSIPIHEVESRFKALKTHREQGHDYEIEDFSGAYDANDYVNDTDDANNADDEFNDDDGNDDDGGYDGNSIEDTPPEERCQILRELLGDRVEPLSSWPKRKRKRNYDKVLESQNENWEDFAKAVVSLSWKSKNTPVCNCQMYTTVRAISFEGIFCRK
jgi:hypothetical protein